MPVYVHLRFCEYVDDVEAVKVYRLLYQDAIHGCKDVETVQDERKPCLLQPDKEYYLHSRVHTFANLFVL
jgi:hypothetical protein